MAMIDSKHFLGTRNPHPPQVLRPSPLSSNASPETLVLPPQDFFSLYTSPSARGKKFYAVRIETKPRIYISWSECEPKIKYYSGAQFRGFKTLSEAERYFLAQ